MFGNEKSWCLSLRGLPEESETHPDIIPSSAIIEGVMSISNMGAFFLGHPVSLQTMIEDKSVMAAEKDGSRKQNI